MILIDNDLYSKVLVTNVFILHNFISLLILLNSCMLSANFWSECNQNLQFISNNTLKSLEVVGPNP